MKNVLVLAPVKEHHKRLLEDKAPSCRFTYAKAESADPSLFGNAEIILGNPSASQLEAARKLEWLQLQSAGVGIYAQKGVLGDGVLLTNASGAYGLAISEYMLAVLLELFKKLHIYRDHQMASDWSYAGRVKSIYGSVALIAGLGDIGGEFAKRLKALGAYTIGVRRINPDKPEYLDELHFMDQFPDLLPQADIVALSLPETSLTNGIVNRDTLKLMKKDAVLINVGRGSAIDMDALCDALESGQLAGAALDVTDPEPLPKEHRLWKLRNAVITPHVSGGFSLPETHDRIIRICADNLESFLQGKELRNIVDRIAGY